MKISCLRIFKLGAATKDKFSESQEIKQVSSYFCIVYGTTVIYGRFCISLYTNFADANSKVLSILYRKL